MSQRTRNLPAVPFVTVFEDLIEMTMFSASAMLRSNDPNSIREVLVETLELLTSLVTRADQIQGPRLKLIWDPDSWLAVLLRCLKSKVSLNDVCGVN